MSEEPIKRIELRGVPQTTLRVLIKARTELEAQVAKERAELDEAVRQIVDIAAEEAGYAPGLQWNLSFEDGQIVLQEKLPVDPEN